MLALLIAASRSRLLYPEHEEMNRGYFEGSGERVFSRFCSLCVLSTTDGAARQKSSNLEDTSPQDDLWEDRANRRCHMWCIFCIHTHGHLCSTPYPAYA